MESQKPQSDDAILSQNEGRKNSRRLSRRQLLYTAAGVAGVAAVGLTAANFAPATVAASASSATAKELAPRPPVEQTELTDDHPLRLAVLASAGIQQLAQRYGVNALTGNRAIHAKYEQTAIEAVTLILRRPGSVDRFVYGYFMPGRDEIKTLQFEFVPSGEMVTAARNGGITPLSGRATYLDATDRVLTSALFRDDRLTATGVVGASARLSAQAGVDWNCFQHHFSTLWPTLPWYAQFLGGALCGGCAGGVIPSCAGCAAALGGYTAAIVQYCWV